MVKDTPSCENIGNMNFVPDGAHFSDMLYSTLKSEDQVKLNFEKKTLKTVTHHFNRTYQVIFLTSMSFI